MRLLHHPIITLFVLVAMVMLALPSQARAANACEWDRPGEHPFMGDVPAAVDHYADIPAATRARLKARMRRFDYDDIVSIRRDAIRGREQYEPDIRSMHFGSGGLCASVTRHSWPAGHEEQGLVYCEDGQCILVPLVCRNVSRITRRPSAGTGAPPEDELVFEPPGAGRPQGAPPSAEETSSPAPPEPVPVLPRRPMPLPLAPALPPAGSLPPSNSTPPFPPAIAPPIAPPDEPPWASDTPPGPALPPLAPPSGTPLLPPDAPPALPPDTPPVAPLQPPPWWQPPLPPIAMPPPPVSDTPPPPVPEPGTFALMALGLAALQKRRPRGAVAQCAAQAD